MSNSRNEPPKGFPRQPTVPVFSADTPPEAMPWWAKPMNSQAGRTEVTRQIMAACQIARIIETGTYLGTTTAFFAGFGLPVTTAERDPDLARDAAERLRPFANVDVRCGDSVRVLQGLLREPIDREVATFFYLDAHFGRHLPIRQEMELAVGYFPRSVMMIDDFQVPDDPGYGFGEERLSLKFLLQGSLQRLAAFFPRLRAEKETGARRGSVVLTANAEMVAALGRIPGLRRFPTRYV